MTKKSHVLILGGGFAGIGAAQELAKADAALMLVDIHDYHTFQPMLYQVATDMIATEEVGHPLRDIFHKQPNLSFHQATVWATSLQGNTLAQALSVSLEKDGRIPVGRDLRMAGYPEVFAVGDTAWITDTTSNVVLHQLGSVALQSGTRRRKYRQSPALRNRRALQVDGQRNHGHHRAPGSGHVDGGRQTDQGQSSGAGLGLVHLTLMSGNDSRTKTMVDWDWSAFGHKRTERIDVDSTAE